MSRAFETKLRRLFERVLLVSLATPVIAVACSDDVVGDGDDDRTDASGDARLSGEACAPVFTDSEVVFFGDGNGLCHAFHAQPCGIPDGMAVIDAGCRFGNNDCHDLCPASGSYRCYTTPEDCIDGVPKSGPVTVVCDFCAIGAGRRPRGWVASRARSSATNELGAYFAELAQLEAASVHAFRRLERDLAAHGAPAALRAGARRARRDEIRHARLTRALATRFGGRVERVMIRRAPAPSLVDLAIENAVEGRVRETYGALAVHHQASGIEDKQTKTAMRRIANDETRHAALAWAIDVWLEPQLSKLERSRVREARRDAIVELERSIIEPSAELARVARLPSRARARAWIRELFAEAR